jgi:RNA polymerase sigma factor (sigma-70 family)
VLTGGPGVGKTELAAAYARAKLAGGWRSVAWVNAQDTGSLLSGLAAVAGAAGLSDGSGRDPATPGQVVRRWLETDGDHRLIVFDDAADPDALRPFIPVSGTARVLITSAEESVAGLGGSVPVDVFSADEAMAVLAGRTGLADDKGAATAAIELAHLPLALALAAPVITLQQVGYARYLDRLHGMPTGVALTGADGQPYPAGVPRTILLSLRAAPPADRTGVCTRVVEIMAVLSAAGVRRELLHAAGQAGALASGGRLVAVGLVDRMLEWLSDRSVLTFSMDGQTVSVHRLVARVIRNELARSEMLTAVCTAAASALDEYSRALAGSPDRLAVRGFRRQVTALLDSTAGSAAGDDKELAEILLRLRSIVFDPSSTSRTQEPLPEGVRYDREVVAAITAGNPAGIAMAYDRYAAALYGYCHWMLRDPADAATALQDTFVIAAATLDGRSDPSTLRPWLFARARNESRRRIRTTSATRDAEVNAANQWSDAGQRADTAGLPAGATDRPIDATMPIRVIGQQAGAMHEPADATMPIPIVGLPVDATMPIRVIGQQAGAMHEPADATMPIPIVGQQNDMTAGLAHVGGDQGQAELQILVSSILAELRPREREVIELSLRHGLRDHDLGIALGMSRSRADALTSLAIDRIEEALGALHVALTRRKACSVLGELLAGWDGRLTEQMRDLVSWHIERCQTCADYGRGALRPEAFSRLLPLAPLPAELRDQVLSRCSSTDEDAVAYRQRVARRAYPGWSARLMQAIRPVSWAGIWANRRARTRHVPMSD